MSDEVYGPDGERLIPFAPVVLSEQEMQSIRAIPADWDLITAGDGVTYWQNEGNKYCWSPLGRSNGNDGLTDAEILALGPVRRAVVVTLPDGWERARYALSASIGEAAIAAALAEEATDDAQ